MNLADFIQKEPVPEKEKKVKVKKITIFDILGAATIKKIDLDFTDDEVRKVYDQFMINRWLSMDESLIFLTEMLTTVHNLSDEDHFQMIKAALPQERFYLKYIKRKKDLTEKEQRYIAHYFEIGLSEAKDYIHQMEDEEISEIIEKYKYGMKSMIKV